jgi:hypothetical protein
MLIFGLAMSVTGLAAAAFATKPWQLVLTQGIIYGIGGSQYPFPLPIVLNPSEPVYTPCQTFYTLPPPSICLNGSKQREGW